MSGRRILLLAPHPDDEAVGCAASIGRARAGGAEFFGLYLTTGVPGEEVLWRWQRGSYRRRVERRRAEALRAAELLGLTPAAFGEWPSRTLKAHLTEALALVEDAIERHGIDSLWVPAWEGAHQDHDAANVLGAAINDRLPVWEYAEYNFAGGETQSQTFISVGSDETILKLDRDQVRHKRALLELYRSERGNLRHVDCERESLRPLPRHDYGRPPHGGCLFRERFHWVPFPHPRIDFESSESVRQALRAWLEGPPPPAASATRTLTP